jgi:glutathione synthase/RimK-type ligase-like ATP-grasp enzyme
MSSSPSLIGIYTRPDDDHRQRVVDELEKRCLPFVCFDSSDFPQVLRLAAHYQTGLSGWQGDLLYQGQRYRLEDFRSIWYRRPSRRYTFVSGLSDEGYEFAKAEAQRGFEGILRSLPCFWVSDPDAIRAAEWKPKQLAYARHVGLRVPRTLITNDPQAALRFFEECQGEIAYKPLSQGIPRPTLGGIWRGAVYTTKMTRSAFQEHLSSVSITATCFQEYVPKAFELRVNVIGSQVFAAEIHSQHSEHARIDFRLGYADLRYSIHTLPAVIAEACQELVRLFRLQFSAIDLLVTPDGQYVFVDLNSNGQWGWIENQTGLPLTEALVSLLERGQAEERAQGEAEGEH